MKHVFSRKAVLAFVGATILVVSLSLAFTKARSIFSKRTRGISAARLNEMPRVILWAWERPTDLHFINPRDTGVAFLARTIHLRSGEVVVRPRLQPLDLPDRITLIAVARVESDSVNRPELCNQQSEKLATAISEMALLPNVSSIQIDFDASRSERSFYRQVIVGVRNRLPDNIGLSITALASWCADDYDWLSDLPVDEAVPMLFRMGPDGRQIRNRVAAGEDFTALLCRGSYGISTDEPLHLSARRFYVFNPDPWTENSVRAITDSTK